MAFFPSSSGFIINGGNFTLQTAATETRKRKGKDSECDSYDDYNELDTKRHRGSSRISDGLVIVKTGDIELRRELISDSDNGYRLHTASHGGRLVVIKTFEGHRAKEDWTVNVTFSKEFFHPNVLQIVGISDESSTRHFIQFHGIASEQKMQWSIANALGTDLNTSVQLSMKAVKGIAAGLSYVKSQNIPIMYPGTVNNDQKWDNFDILTGYDNEPIIAFHLSSPICEDGSISQNLDIRTDVRGIEILNGLCRQLFSGANSIIYDDSPEREFDTYDGEGLPTATLERDEGTSNLSESEAISSTSNPSEKPKPRRKPRREVWWLEQGATNQSLKSIGQCFEDRLNRSLLSSSNPLLRQIRSPKDDDLRQNMHQCPGYLREEITLTCDVSKSAIVSHAFPGQNELCSICHQLVQYTYSDYNSLSLDPPDGSLPPQLPHEQQHSFQVPGSHSRSSSISSMDVDEMILRATATGDGHTRGGTSNETETSYPDSTSVNPASTQSPSSPVRPSTTEDGSTILFYEALYDYSATIEEEFDFKAGDLIAVTATPPDGWWSGELLDINRRQKGQYIFPSNFTRVTQLL